MKSPIKRIRLTLLEGYTTPEPPSVEVSTFAAATAVLVDWSQTAPKEGYNKARVELTWENGHEHHYRVGLGHPSTTEPPDVSADLQFEIELVLGRYRDPDLTDKQQEQLLAHYREFGLTERIEAIDRDCMTQD
jgi:hypothetical protein